MAERVFNVLFLCTRNSARSIMAECILNTIGEGRFRGFSAGNWPSGELMPEAVDLLTRSGFDTTKVRSKSWNEFADAGAPPLDFVFTLCDQAAGETCPVWPGQPMTAHWPFSDPAQFEGAVAEKRAFVADIFRQINNRLGIFINLPFASLDRISLQNEIDRLGRDIEETTADS